MINVTSGHIEDGGACTGCDSHGIPTRLILMGPRHRSATVMFKLCRTCEQDLCSQLRSQA